VKLDLYKKTRLSLKSTWLIPWKDEPLWKVILIDMIEMDVK